MVQLFGDLLQASQQPALLQASPKPPVVQKTPPRSVPAVLPPVQTPAQPKQLNGTFNTFIGTRPSPSSPGVLEYYNKQTGQGFPNPQALFAFASQLSGQQITDFSQLEGPSTGNSPAPVDPNQQFAQEAARAGLSIDDYLKIMRGPGLTPEDRNAINQGLGIPDLENQIFTPPAKNTQQLYTEAYASAGLADLKLKIQSKIDEINKARTNFTDAEGTVNENPWLAEASRVGRVSRLSDKAQQTISNLNNELSQFTDLYNNGVNEVNSLVSRQSADFSQNQQLSTQKLQYLLTKAETLYSDKQNEKSKTAYQYLPEYLTAKAKAQKPDTIGNTETGFYKWNPDTGTFEEAIPPVTKPIEVNPGNTLIDPTTGKSLYQAPAKGKTATTKPTVKISLSEGTNYADQYLSPRRGQDGYVSPEDFKKAKQAWLDDKLDVNTFYARFKKYINPSRQQDY